MKKVISKFILFCITTLFVLTGCNKSTVGDTTLEELKTANVKEYYSKVNLTDIFHESGYLRTSVDLSNNKITKGGTKEGIHYSFKEYNHTTVEKWETEDYIYATYVDKETTEVLKIKYKNDYYSSTYSNYLISFRGAAYKATIGDYDLVEIYNSDKKCTAYFDSTSKEIEKVGCSSFIATYSNDLDFDAVDFNEFQEVSVINAYDINLRYVD